MKGRIKLFGGAFVLMCVLSLITLVPANAAEMKHMHGKGADMDMHHMHILMSHGLEMVAEGSNLVMLAQMKMAPSVDPMTLAHGRSMIKDGKEVIEHAMNGHEMKAMHKAGHGNDPLMKYTHELGGAMMDVVNALEEMSTKEMSPDMMTMHHMHMLMNHALVMATEGSNMMMLGRMGMAKDIDKYSVEHGKMMVSDARSLLKEVMEGKAMTEMHEKGVKPADNAMMAETHKIGDAEMKVIDLLEKMPSAGSM